MKTKKVTVTSVFPASMDVVWKRLTRIETLRYIAAPFASFAPLTAEDALVWREGATARYRLRIFGILSFGVHTIHVRTFDEKTHRVYTEESNKSVPIWNHTITLEPIDQKAVRYTDIVELGAGWRTGIVAAWSGAFYRHRQKRWLRLLKEAY